MLNSVDSPLKKVKVFSALEFGSGAQDRGVRDEECSEFDYYLGSVATYKHADRAQ